MPLGVGRQATESGDHLNILGLSVKASRMMVVGSQRTSEIFQIKSF